MLPGGTTRQAFTDDSGAFVFTRLPPGTYRVTANPMTTRPQYLAIIHGASDPMQPGRAVEVAEGDRVSGIDIAVPRAAVITGRVTDAAGDPVARANVYGFLFRGADIIRNGGATTDDLGGFRMYGLAPGEYVVVAETRLPTGPTGYLPTFSPGTVNPTQAARIRVRAGQDASADIRMAEGRLFRISGSVVNARREPVPGADVRVARRDAFGQITALSAVSEANGGFSVSNLPPGEYRLLARPSAVAGAPRLEAETALEMVAIGRSDVTGLALVLRPGATITGTIASDAPNPARLRVMGIAPDRWRSTSSDVSVDAVGNGFTLRNLSGEKVIRVSSLSPGWTLMSVQLNGRDITDVPTRFGPQDDGRVLVSLTARASSIDGMVVTRDAPVSPHRNGGMVVLFGQDPAGWFARSIMFRTMPIGADGTFRINQLRPGRYHVVALPLARSRGISEPPREVLEALTREAMSLTLLAGEHRKMTLRIAAGEAR
jgi:hypothetical protein